MTHWVLVGAAGTLAALIAAFPIYRSDPYALPVFGLSLLAVLASWVVLRLGHVRAAGVLVCSASWLLVVVVSVTSGGVSSPQLATMVLVVMLIGFLWGSRAALIAAGVTSVTILALILAADRGLLPADARRPTATADWGAMTAVLVIAAVFLHLTLRAIDQSRRELEQTSRELKQEMARRAAAEESLLRAQKLEALGRLTGGIAHDFNNLLTVLLAHSEMLEERAAAGETLGPEAAAEIRDIRISAERAAALTRRLLGFSRPQPGTPEDVDPTVVFERLAPVFERVIPENIRLKLVPPRGGLSICIDPAQLEQVILNLVLNARDAMPEGGELRVEGCDVAGTGAPGEGPYLEISVSDSGPGVPLEDRARIFDPFFTTKDVGRGTGLGLSIVHGIVKRAGGQVLVESEPGRGTTLRALFPARAVEAPTVAAASRGSDRARAPRPGTILVCEDEEAVRKIMLGALRGAGYAVIEASHPERALEIARKGARAIDLLVSDVVMPEMNGRELAEALRGELGPIPALLVTGYASSDVDLRRGGSDGIDLLQKPFETGELLDRVAALLAAEPG